MPVRRALLAPLAAALLLPAAASAQRGPGPPRIDLLSFAPMTPEEWERATRRSDSPPLRLSELDEMRAAGIGDATLLEMVRTRRVRDRVAPKDLIALKKKGASDDLIAALSAYALAENRSIDLALTVDVRSPHSLAQAPYLYVEFFQVKAKVREHLLFADLRRLVARGEVIQDRSDPLLPDRVARVRIAGAVPLRHPGPVEVRVLVSKRPDLVRLDQLPPAEQARLTTFTFELPAVSLYNDCEMELGLARDAVVADLFTIERKRLVCIFD